MYVGVVGLYSVGSIQWIAQSQKMGSNLDTNLLPKKTYLIRSPSNLFRSIVADLSRSFPIVQHFTLDIFFQILWKTRCHTLVFFPSSFEKITLYTEILSWKVELWLFSLISLMKKDHKTTFQIFSDLNLKIYIRSNFVLRSFENLRSNSDHPKKWDIAFRSF